MSRVRVDLAALDSLVSQLSSYAAHLERLRDAAAAQQLRLGGSWAGAAAATQADAQARWAAAAEEVHSALLVLRGVGATAHANYAAALAANRRMWSG